MCLDFTNWTVQFLFLYYRSLMNNHWHSTKVLFKFCFSVSCLLQRFRGPALSRKCDHQGLGFLSIHLYYPGLKTDSHQQLWWTEMITYVGLFMSAVCLITFQGQSQRSSDQQIIRSVCQLNLSGKQAILGCFQCSQEIWTVDVHFKTFCFVHLSLFINADAF